MIFGRAVEFQRGVFPGFQVFFFEQFFCGNLGGVEGDLDE